MHTNQIISVLGLTLFVIVGCNAKTDNNSEKPAQAANAEAPKADSNAEAKDANAKAEADNKAPKADNKAPEADNKAAEAGENKPNEAKADAADDKDEPAPAQAKDVQPAPAGDSLIKTAKDNGTPAIEGTVCDEPEGCDCNGTKCPMNAVCGETCICGNKEVPPDAGYQCIEIAKNVYDLGCTEKDGCECGKIKVYANMGCENGHATCAGSPVPGRGLSCGRKPYKKNLFSLNCFKDECDCYGETIQKGEVCPPLECERGFTPSVLGCACGGIRDDGESLCVPARDGKQVFYCMKDDGCECGDQTCSSGSVCYHKKCVDRATLKPIPEEYELSFGLPKCTSESCACGKKGKCNEGKYCLDGTCYGNPYKRSIDGKVYYYHIFSKEIVDAGPKEQYRNDLWSLMFINLNNDNNEAEPVRICSLFDSVKVKGSDDDICKSEKGAEMTLADILTRCGTAEIPEKVATMYCTLDVVDGALQFSGWEAE